MLPCGGLGESLRRGTAAHAAAFAVLLAVAPAAAECDSTARPTPRTLILALDGVPYRAVRVAREMGAFAGWAEPRPLVSTFPSMTNVGFAAILEPFGAERIPGYEIRYYDRERNEVVGGGVFGLKFEWRRHFQIRLGGWWPKSGLYFTPRASARKEMHHVARWVLETPDDVMLALISSTDPLMHFKGEDAVVDLLVEFSREIEDLRRGHERRERRPLDVVLLSDHGNAGGKVRRPDGLLRMLRRGGLSPAKRLGGPDDVIAQSFGIVGYGALYLDPSRAERAARIVLEHRGVGLAAWLEGESELRLLTDAGSAEIEWRSDRSGERMAYRPDRGDPFDLAATLAHMRQAGRLDAQGFASREDWFEWTARDRYPDGVARLVDSLRGTWVGNAATVIFSYEPGYAWGLKPAEVAAWIRSGRLEATHGGLDRESTWGFFMTSDPDLPTPPAVRAERALTRWSSAAGCSTAALLEFTGGRDVHDARAGRR